MPRHEQPAAFPNALDELPINPNMVNDNEICDGGAVYVVHRDTLRDSTPSLKRDATDTAL
ncbi:MAG TPA: hypothetical protein VGA50_20995 [Kiloniellales bacterium]